MVIDNGSIVTVTDKAAEKAKAILIERGIENGALRVFVVSGGCSGYQYGMAIARSREEDDISIEASGITLLVDAESAPLIEGVLHVKGAFVYPEASASTEDHHG